MGVVTTSAIKGDIGRYTNIPRAAEPMSEHREAIEEPAPPGA